MDEKYTKIREDWQERKSELIQLAESHENIGTNAGTSQLIESKSHEIDAKVYRNMIESRRPKTEDAEYVCPNLECDCFGMEKVSSGTEESEQVNKYKCVFCGYSEEINPK